MNGQKISITPANASFLEACARELENDELLGRTISFQLDREDVSMANVVDRIRIRREFHSDFVRLWQTGKDSGNNDHLMLSEIEFFGTVKNEWNRS